MHSTSVLQDKISAAFERERFLFEPPELYLPIEYALAQGGKRLRPLLVLMSCDLFGGDVDAAMKPSIGVELFHNFTLLHDDIMDNAFIRRGKPSVHAKWNANVAILSGDTMFVMAYDYISMVSPSHLPAVIALFNDTARKVCEGQQYDMNFETLKDVSIGDYLSMIRLKTAVLLACSLKLGAILGGADEEDTENIYRFGEALGMSFQLRDDFLDVFGEVEKFGKEIGGDIITHKKTYLYIKAFEVALGEDRVRLSNHFSNHEEERTSKVNNVKDLYVKLGVDQDTRALISDYLKVALDYLDRVKAVPGRKQALRELALEMINRES